MKLNLPQLWGQAGNSALTRSTEKMPLGLAGYGERGRNVRIKVEIKIEGKECDVLRQTLLCYWPVFSTTMAREGALWMGDVSCETSDDALCMPR
ncbi:hypothetical protein E2C01_086957 [Portunus trituberculatus]|uniref:Uncharacterized protein n=1 Tax=Portunus trituberculatus TaxID=210409 RepID=A0A5B7JHS7_PORTR|nr:hypothetical protein [Portunus trituberculatus]